MNFLADENVERPIVEALRNLGCDVCYLSEFTKQTIDDLLLDQANQESRILLTNDKDFGELVYLQRKNTVGIVLMRFTIAKSSHKARYMVSLLKTYGDRLNGSFTVVSESKIRIRKL